MENDSRPAKEIQAEITALTEEYEALTGEKLLVRRIKAHRPQEIWAWMSSLAHEYSVLTGNKIRFEEDPGKPKKDSILHCSFCGKSQEEVLKMIAGPKVAICDECVALCVSIVEEPSG